METFNADSSSGLFVSHVKEEKPDLESKNLTWRLLFKCRHLSVDDPEGGRRVTKTCESTWRGMLVHTEGSQGP